MLAGVLGSGGKLLRRLALGAGLVGAVAASVEVGAITLVSAITGAIWHQIAYEHSGDVGAFVDVGVLTGLLYVVPFLLGGDYRVERLIAERRPLARVLNVWACAFFALAALAFLTKTTGTASRGALGLFFVLGGVTVICTEALLRHSVRMLVAAGLVAPRRLLIVGRPAEVDAFVARHSFAETGAFVAATVRLPDPAGQGGSAIRGELEPHIAAALAAARSASVDDVLIVLDESDRAGLGGQLAERFLDLPVAVHLGQLTIARQFPRLEVGSVAGTPTLSLRSAPLDPYQRLVKRAFDLVVAGLALVLLALPLALVALLIKLDSPGPVFFRQRRRGFNQREFRIWKFRTMSTLDDGPVVKQAVADDPRVTRIGRVLRRYNIDELPQLINVLRGEMSIVGPRPHAVAHDEHYERVITRYGRRLNVKPGITGWAQVNGFRGLTETDHAMRSRINHDLYYIDNWSLAFDLYIVGLTVLSPKAFRNAH